MIKIVIDQPQIQTAVIVDSELRIDFDLTLLTVECQNRNADNGKIHQSAILDPVDCRGDYRPGGPTDARNKRA